MIRKAFIVVLTLATVLVVFVSWWSYSKPIRTEIRLTKRSLLCLHFVEGFARFTWLLCDDELSIEYEPLTMSPATGNGVAYLARMHIRTASGCRYPVAHIAMAEAFPQIGLPTHQAVHNLWPSRTTGCPPLHRIFVRTRWWLVCTIIAAYPIVAFIRGPLRRWRRKRKGLCLKCGYDMMGNESGVCPECGTEVEAK